MTTTQTPKAPAGLGDAGRALWRSVTRWEPTGDRLVLRPDELAILSAACGTADLIGTLERDIAGPPTVIISGSGVKRIDPVIRELRSQRALLLALVSRLDLPEANSDTGSDNITAAQRARKAARARWA